MAYILNPIVTNYAEQAGMDLSKSGMVAYAMRGISKDFDRYQAEISTLKEAQVSLQEQYILKDLAWREKHSALLDKYIILAEKVV